MVRTRLKVKGDKAYFTSNTIVASDGSSQRSNKAFNSLRPRPNRRHFADDILKCIFLNENVWISIKISLKFVPKGPINNIPALVQIMAWRRPGDKPLSEPMMVRLPTHICVTRPQWVKAKIQLTWFCQYPDSAIQELITMLKSAYLD